jgi:putative phosphoesterase
MTILRIAAVSDTHDYSPDFVLKDVMSFSPDLVIHNGDFTLQETYDVYASTVPQGCFHAVRGDKDNLLNLERTNVIKANRTRIGQIHGDRAPKREQCSVTFNSFLRGHFYYWDGFARDAIDCFPDELDILFTGHLHIPFKRQVKRTLVVNPGAIVVNGHPHHLKVPTMAVVDIREKGIQATILALQEGGPPIPVPVDGNGPIKAWWSKVFRPVTTSNPLNDMRDASPIIPNISIAVGQHD